MIARSIAALTLSLACGASAAAFEIRIGPDACDARNDIAYGNPVDEDSPVELNPWRAVVDFENGFIAAAPARRAQLRPTRYYAPIELYPEQAAPNDECAE